MTAENSKPTKIVDVTAELTCPKHFTDQLDTE